MNQNCFFSSVAEVLLTMIIRCHVGLKHVREEKSVPIELANNKTIYISFHYEFSELKWWVHFIHYTESISV